MRGTPYALVLAGAAAVALVRSGFDAAPIAVEAATTERAAQFSIRGRLAPPRRLSYHADPANSPIAAEPFARAIDRAAAIWNALGVVSLVRATDADAADITLSWHRGHHGACRPFGRSADVAHAGPVGTDTFVHFDLDRDWGADGEGGVSLYATAVHEFGHLFGLGHSEAPEAVMGTASKRPTALSWHELAGLHSLYGGGEDGPGDLYITANSSRQAVLRRVAPPRICGFAAFDCDGDGRDEVLVWRTDPAGHGALTIYHFSASLKLERSFGPIYGAVGAGAAVGLVDSTNGHRFLTSTYATGKSDVRQFDRHGLPGRLRATFDVRLLSRAAPRGVGDLDGDGCPERISR